MKALPLEPIVERSTKSTENSLNDASRSKTSSAVPEPRLESNFVASDSGGFQDITSELSLGSRRPDLPFYEQQRNYPSEVIDGPNRSDQIDYSKSDVLTQVEGLRRLDTTGNRPNLPRSVSILSQQSGHAPNERLPSPAPSLPHRVQALREHHDPTSKRGSLASSASVDSSILNDGDSNPFLSSVTDYTSVCAFSPFNFETSKRSPHIFDGERNPWNWSKIKPASSSQSSTTTTIQPLIGSQSSFRASIEQHQLPRSINNGFSPSLMDKYVPSWNPSSISQNSNLDQEHLKAYDAKSVNIFKQNEDNIKALTSHEGPLRGHVHSTSEQVFGRNSNNPTSISILQDTSGNQACPLENTYKKRPSSIATDQPFRWDAETSVYPGKPSIMKGRIEGHKRQPCQRIVVTAPASKSSTFASLIEEPEENCESTLDPAIPGILVATPEKTQMSPRPPSCATFDPHIRISPQRNGLQPEDRYYSATMSMYNLHNEVYDTNFDSTPTRKPSRRRRPHNDQKTDLDDRHDPNWPLVLPSSQPISIEKSTTSTTEMRSNDVQSPIPPLDTQPPSFLFSFPAPPKAPDWHRPSTRIIHGPRAAPLRTRSPRRKPPRQLSPLRNATRYSPRCSPQHLLASAVALRRMNSELSTFDSNERRQFVNLGGGSLVEEDSREEQFLQTGVSDFSLKVAAGN